MPPLRPVAVRRNQWKRKGGRNSGCCRRPRHQDFVGSAWRRFGCCSRIDFVTPSFWILERGTFQDAFKVRQRPGPFEGRAAKSGSKLPALQTLRDFIGPGFPMWQWTHRDGEGVCLSLKQRDDFPLHFLCALCVLCGLNRPSFPGSKTRKGTKKTEAN